MKNANMIPAAAAAVKTLLKENPAALRDLHITYGFDFCAPLEVVEHNGPFTVRKALAELNAAPENGYKIAVIFSRYRANYAEPEQKAAEITTGNRVDIESVKNYHAHTLCHFWRKADFEERRKESTCTAWFVAQREQLLKPWKNPAEELNHAERYKVKPDSVTKCRYNGETSISDFRVYNPCVNGSEATYYPDTDSTHRSMIYYSRDYHPATVGEVIDKSGYFVKPRREDLKRRAAALRAEREKAAYQEQDNSRETAELEAVIKEAVQTAAAAVATSTPENLGDIASAIQWTLATNIRYFERYKRNEAEKAFSTREAAARERESIRAGIERFLATVNECKEGAQE